MLPTAGCYVVAASPLGAPVPSGHQQCVATCSSGCVLVCLSPPRDFSSRAAVCAAPGDGALLRLSARAVMSCCWRVWAEGCGCHLRPLPPVTQSRGLQLGPAQGGDLPQCCTAVRVRRWGLTPAGLEVKIPKYELVPRAGACLGCGGAGGSQQWATDLLSEESCPRHGDVMLTPTWVWLAPRP